MTTTVSKIFEWFKTILIHLWLSISSIDFYRKVISSYEGYGIKYILTISLFSSFLCSILILNYLDNIKQYFSNETISSSVINLDHVISQFPELYYNGEKISLEDPEPIYINNIYNQPVIAIDPENKLSSTERTKIPILLTNKKIIFSFIDLQKNNINSFPIDYQQLFGQENKTITQEVLRSILKDVFNNANRIFIYALFPIIGLLIFFNVLLEKAFIIIMVYLFTNFLSIKITLKTCTRLTMFASGFFVLLQPIILLMVPSYIKIIWILQIWSNFLMVLGILRSSNYQIFRRRK